MAIGTKPVMSYIKLTKVVLITAFLLYYTDYQKDLGIWIMSIISCNQVLSVRRPTIEPCIILQQLNAPCLRNFYIWPHIKFCVQAWNPYNAKHILFVNIVLPNLSPNYVCDQILENQPYWHA